MAAMDEVAARAAVAGKLDVRKAAGELTARGMTMDPVERDQYVTILQVAAIEHAASVARWTKWLAFATFALAVATVVIALCD